MIGILCRGKTKERKQRKKDEEQKNMGKKMFMIPVPLEGIFMQLENVVALRQPKIVYLFIFLFMWVNRKKGTILF